MLTAIVGGRLQGVELTCLAKKAGWQTLLVDRNTHVPAQGLCDQFLQMDVGQTPALDKALGAVDLVVPAVENQTALDNLMQWGRTRKIPVAFDPEAYAISSSKIVSNRLLASLGIAMPMPWPRCGFPVVAKPSHGSGSEKVAVLRSQKDAEAIFPCGLPDDGWVVEQYLDGPSFSLEVIGRPGNYVPIQVTELFMDAVYDCKAVAAPCRLTVGQIREIEKIGVTIAEAIRLKGLMDVEVILHDGDFKVLEIDARFPSQTPLAVYHSTGCNMFEMLADLFLAGQSALRLPAAPARGTILKHIRVRPEAIFVEGEHIMAQAGPLSHLTGFFGADEALTNYGEMASQWVATLIAGSRTCAQAEKKCGRVLAAIQRDLKIDNIFDRCPENAP
jgi:pyrrolysine biosynthesis protein PylC